MGEQGQSRAQQGWLGRGWGWWQRGGFWACLESGQCLIPLVSHWYQAQRLPGAPWVCPCLISVEVSRAEVPTSDVQARGVLGSMVLPTGLRPSLGCALDATWKLCSVLMLTFLDAAATSPIATPAPHSKLSGQYHQDLARNAASRPRHPHHTAASLARSISYTIGKRSGELIEAGEDPPPRGTGAAIGTPVKAPSPCPLCWGPWAGSQLLPMATVVCQAPALALLAGSQCSAGYLQGLDEGSQQNSGPKDGHILIPGPCDCQVTRQGE